MKLAEYIFERDNVVHVIQLKTGQNKKLGIGKVIVQTYHFAKDQIVSGDLTNDSANCLDCPFSYNQNDGKTGGCYTHKGMQRMGLLAILRSLNKRYKTGYGKMTFDKFLSIASAYDLDMVRFGTYGEPVLLPIDMVTKLASLVDKKRWTGYTHQWNKPEFAPYAAYFQASCHNIFEANIAKDMGWRSFVVVPEHIDNAVNCPASKEAGNKTTCSQCSLCNGTSGNSSKDIYILQH